MKISPSILLLCFSAFAAPQAIACYTVYNPANTVVYSSQNAPIDMSYQIHQKLPAAFPGGHMVFGADTDCPQIDVRRAALQAGTVAVVAPRAAVTARNPRMSEAARNREIDALTK
ncbi:MAG: hypothetical protein V4614_12030 [Pseudomonadota bacterium]